MKRDILCTLLLFTLGFFCGAVLVDQWHLNGAKKSAEHEIEIESVQVKSLKTLLNAEGYNFEIE